jgi:hypothetical protein
VEVTNEPLKPCPVPWCGGDAEVIYEDFEGEDNFDARVICQKCQCGTEWHVNECSAREQWNTRPEPQSAWQPIETLDIGNDRRLLVKDVRTGQMIFVWCHCLKGVFDKWTHWCEVPG